MRGHTRCLLAPGNPCALGALRDRARRYLVPHAIQIRNGVKPEQAANPAASATCESVPGPPWKDIDTFSDIRAPLKTVFNTIGTGTNGRVEGTTAAVQCRHGGCCATAMDASMRV